MNLNKKVVDCRKYFLINFESKKNKKLSKVHEYLRQNMHTQPYKTDKA
ncbi:hypothetical protein M23134_08235 [Microscilla marina ATCC 23134]|uniref:Uncharacterized protein n=1 Tax=Microscilla marina ATCC 23134 TaxID=313606 RepID=A1ZHD7_MICM2|nr:hypothetical protein M23134_08235 [Microscilla marina ATCC 23134]